MDKKKLLFFALWLGLLAIGPYTIFSNTQFSLAFANRVVSVNTIQRLFGLWLFTLIFIQIILGSNMDKIIEKLGSWVLRFHIIEGLITYSLVVLHPLAFVVFNYFIKGVIDPFYVYTDVCVACRNSFELFYTFGRVSFWLLTATVTAGYFRSHPALFKNWRKIHILNYAVFFLIFLHGMNIGSDFKTQPFWGFALMAAGLVTLSVIFRLKKKFQRRTSKGTES